MNVCKVASRIRLRFSDTSVIGSSRLPIPITATTALISMLYGVLYRKK